MMPRPPRQTPREDSPDPKDISAALSDWPFEPGQVNVRLIRGSDGKPKIQLRLDLGLLQMEINGRPDGRRPHRHLSELAYNQRRLEQHRKRVGGDQGFELSPRQCAALREESAMFYHRYLAMFVLEQYEAVLRDTQHNLDVLDLCQKYARQDFDRAVLEEFRPYILMMRTRAQACEALRRGYIRTALAYLRGGLREIAQLVPPGHRKRMIRRSTEGKILRDMIRSIEAQLPADPRIELQTRLNHAIKAERFEEAAALRDEIEALRHGPASSIAKHRDSATRKQPSTSRKKRD